MNSDESIVPPGFTLDAIIVKTENQGPDGDLVISRKIQYTVGGVAVPNIAPEEIAASISEQENTCSSWHERMIQISQRILMNVSTA
jgi:hypothetical protein